MHHLSIKQIFLIIVILTVVIGAYFAYDMRDSKFIAVTETPVDTPIDTTIPTPHGTFTFLDRNFKFNLDEAWTAPTGTIAYPKDIGDVSFAFRKNSTTCILAYANEPGQNIFDSYSQSSFSDRVVTVDKTHLDTSWYVHKDNLPAGFDFADNQTLAGEVRLTRYPEWSAGDFGEQGYFLLFDEKGGKVDPVCSTNASTMLSTLEMTYPDISLDVKSEGYVYVGTRSGGSPSIRFISDEGPTIYNIIDISADFPPAPFVYGDRIYYSKAGDLFEVNVFSRNIEKIPVPVSDGAVINDFTIYNGTVYYLAGRDCRGYKEICSSDLVSYNMSTKVSEVIAKDSISRTILGLDAVENKLYMRFVEGDGGCFKKTDEVFDLSKKTLSKSEPFVGCEGDPGINKVLEEMESMERKFGYDRNDSVIRLDEGKLFKEGGPQWAIGSSTWVRFSGFVPI
jgi:hypothetical protein